MGGGGGCKIKAYSESGQEESFYVKACMCMSVCLC